jgi:hypothetical protein
LANIDAVAIRILKYEGPQAIILVLQALYDPYAVLLAPDK